MRAAAVHTREAVPLNSIESQRAVLAMWREAFADVRREIVGRQNAIHYALCSFGVVVIRNRDIAVQSITTAFGALSRRPETGSDETFLFSLFESVKVPEMARMPVDEGMKARLLRMQYLAMTQSYRTAYPDAAFDVITMDDKPIGRLIMDGTHGCLHIVYIAFVPAWRRHGIGFAIMGPVLAEARKSNLVVEARVALDNVASLRLWTRLGFTERTRDAADAVLEWQPPIVSIM